MSVLDRPQWQFPAWAARLIWLALLLLPFLAFALSALPLDDKLKSVAYSVCAQRPSHSFFLDGAQLPLEARMGGIFTGFLLAFLFFWAIGKGKAARLPGGAEAFLLYGFLVFTAIDGLNAVASGMRVGPLYPPSNHLRSASGLLAGYATAALAMPVVSFALWKDWTHERIVEGPAEVAMALGLLAVAHWASSSGPDWAYLPVSLAQVGGVVVSMAVGGTFIGLLIRRTYEKASNVAEALPAIVPGLYLTIALLMALRLWRQWLEISQGYKWPV